jgi:hypothetical protein
MMTNRASTANHANHASVVSLVSLVNVVMTRRRVMLTVLDSDRLRRLKRHSRPNSPMKLAILDLVAQVLARMMVESVDDRVRVVANYER